MYVHVYMLLFIDGIHDFTPYMDDLGILSYLVSLYIIKHAYKHCLHRGCPFISRARVIGMSFAYYTIHMHISEAPFNII